MELSAASKWGKIIEPDLDKGIANMKSSMEAYKRARAFVDEYKVKKEIKSDADLEESLKTQMNICDEMIELIPQKIDRMNQAK